MAVTTLVVVVIFCSCSCFVARVGVPSFEVSIGLIMEEPREPAA